ncbi:hypothetical protein [Tunturiibacter gelidiferens]|uniref:hypothetical protein n=1 Tax=Tunturiibacter gelidiferens TaxID=3069689 RepID=UPI003D9B23E2
MGSHFQTIRGKYMTAICQSEKPERKLAKEIVSRLVRSTIGTSWTRNIEPLDGDPDAEFPTEQDLMTDAMNLAMGEDTGCRSKEDSNFRESVDVLWLEDLLKAAFQSVPVGEPTATTVDLMSMSEIDRMAHCLAFENASSFLDCNTVSEGDGWMNVSEESVDDHDAFEEIEFGLRYLELRGLLVRHPEKPWVKLLDEEATPPTQ